MPLIEVRPSPTARLLEAVRSAATTLECTQEGHIRAIERQAADLQTREAMVIRAYRELAVAGRALADWADSMADSADQGDR